MWTLTTHTVISNPKRDNSSDDAADAFAEAKEPDPLAILSAKATCVCPPSTGRRHMSCCVLRCLLCMRPNSNPHENVCKGGVG
eukprot:3808887-Amphidinium_carterae.1